MPCTTIGDGRLTEVEADRQLGITPRQVRRLLAAQERDGPLKRGGHHC